MLQVLVYKFTPPSTLSFVRNITSMIGAPSFSTKLNGGFADCTVRITSRFQSAFDWYDRRLMWMLRIEDGAQQTVWEGRIEDVSVEQAGVNITALGYYSHLKDRIYSIPWYSVVDTVSVKSVGEDWFLTDPQNPIDVDSIANGEYYISVPAIVNNGITNADRTITTLPFATGNTAALHTQFEQKTEIPASARYNIGPEDSLTAECFVKIPASETTYERCIISNESVGTNEQNKWRSFWGLHMMADGKLRFFYSITEEPFVSPGGPATPSLSGNAVINDDAYHHIAMVKNASNNTIRLYVDGVLDASRTMRKPGTITCTAPIRIAWDNANYRHYRDPDSTAEDYMLVCPLSAYIDEVRVSKVARYESNFTPPSANLASDVFTLLLLHFDETTGWETVEDSAAIGWGDGEEASSFIYAAQIAQIDMQPYDGVDTTVYKLTTVGDIESCLMIGDDVIIGHKGTQGDIIQDAIGLCPLISTSYANIDPDGLLVTDVTPQEFDENSTVMNVVESLTKYGSGEVNPRPVYFAIWENREPYLFAADITKNKWQIRLRDVQSTAGLDLTRSVKDMANRVFALFSGDGGAKLATDIYPDYLSAGQLLTDAEQSQDDYGIIERGISVGSVTQEEAELFAQQFLQDELEPNQSSSLTLKGTIGGAAGARHYLWEVRAGDVIEIIDLLDADLPVASRTLQKLKNFVVKATEYNSATNELKVTPEGEVSTVDMLLALSEIVTKRSA